jgi:hypothetical protein
MLTDETAKSLAAAMNRLAEAIEKLGAPGLQPGGIHVWHHGIQQPTFQPAVQPYNPFSQPWTVRSASGMNAVAVPGAATYGPDN